MENVVWLYLVLRRQAPGASHQRLVYLLCTFLVTMPPRTISKDLKERVPALFYSHGYKVKDICTILGVQKSFVYQCLDFYRKYGVPWNPHSRRTGRHRVLNHMDLRYITALLRQKQSIYLDEIQHKLQTHRYIHISVPTLFRVLRNFHYSLKNVSVEAKERNDMERMLFMNEMADIMTNPDQLMCIDEAHRNRRTSVRKKGRTPIGIRCVSRRHFVRGQRVSILPVLTIDGIIVHDIIPGSVTSLRFLEFLRECVVSLNSSSEKANVYDSFIDPSYESLSRSPKHPSAR